VYPDMLEKFSMLIAHAMLFQSKRGASVVYTALQVGHLRGCSNFWWPRSPKLKTLDLFCRYPNRDAVNVPTTTSLELLRGMDWCG